MLAVSNHGVGEVGWMENIWMERERVGTRVGPKCWLSVSFEFQLQRIKRDGWVAFDRVSPKCATKFQINSLQLGFFQTFHSYFCFSPRVSTPAHANYCCKNSHIMLTELQRIFELTKLKYLLP